MRIFQLVGIWLVVACPLMAQITEYYDTNWNRLDSEEMAAYYREITYDAYGKPVGKVRDFSTDGVLEFEGSLCSVNPDVLDGECSWFNDTGKRSFYGIFKNGILQEKPTFKNKRNETKADNEVPYFTEGFLAKEVKKLDGLLIDEGIVDSNSVFYFIDLGQSYKDNGLHWQGLFSFLLAHDLSLLTADKLRFLGIIYSQIGLLLNAANLNDEAVAWFKEGYSLLLEAGDKKEQVSASNKIGWFYLDQGIYNEALIWHMKTKDLLEELGWKAELATGYNNIGMVYGYQGNFDQAMKWHTKALEIREWLGLETGLAESYHNIGFICAQRGNHDEALKWYNKATTIREIFGPDDALASTYKNIGAIYQTQGRLAQSLIWNNKSMVIFQRLGNEQQLVSIYNNFGVVYKSQGLVEQALHWHYKAERLCKRMNHDSGLAQTYSNIGQAHHSQGWYEEALKWYQKATEIRKRLGQEVELAYSYDDIGGACSASGRFDEALSWYRKGLLIKERLGSEVDLATSFDNLGEIYGARGNQDVALDWFERSLQVRKRLKLEVPIAISYDNIAGVYKSKGEFRKALDLLFKGKEIREKLGLEIDVSFSFNAIAEVYVMVGQYDEALSWHHKARHVRERTGLLSPLATTYNNIAEVYRAQGRYEDAVRWHKEALNIRDSLGAELDLVITFNNMAEICRMQGKYDMALNWHKKAMAIEERLGLQIFLAYSYNNIGLLKITQSDFEEAMNWLEKAKGIIEGAGMKVELAQNLDNIAVVYNLQEDFELAIYWYGKARDIRESLGLRIGLTQSYNNIGFCHFSKGNYEEALSSFKKAKVLCDSLKLKHSLAVSYNNMAVVYDTLGNYEQALDLYTAANQFFEFIQDRLYLVSSYSNMASTFHKISRSDSALHYAQKSIDLGENLREFNAGERNRQLFVLKALNAIEIGLESAFQLQRLPLAFKISEKSKARSLSDLLFQKGIVAKDIPAYQLVTERSLKDRISALEMKLSKDIVVELRRNLTAQRDSLYMLWQEARDQIKLISTDYCGLTYSDNIDLEQLKSILRQNEVVVSYFSGKKKTFALLITSSLMKMIDLGSSNSLRLLVENYRNNLVPGQKLAIQRQDVILQSGVDEQFFELSSELYQKIWSPLDSTGLLKDKKVIIVPDGFLNYLPFELLINDVEQKAYEEYNYLIHDYTISYYPSATVLYYERTKEHEKELPTKNFFGLGITEFENSNCTNNDNVYADLSTIAASIDQLGDLFGSDQGVTLLNEQASESEFKSLDMTNYRYLHFATHGTIDTETPDFSSILLRPDDQENGCLNMYEIFELDFNADLVTLAACQTGLGKLVRGEGMVGFTRALMYAGTPSVILSLWEVADESTNQLFLDYYSKLAKDGSDKYAPLRSAQLKMIESGEYANPYYWAPFVFIGARESKF